MSWTRKVRVAICRLCYGRIEHPQIGTWLAQTMYAAARDERIGGLHEFWIDTSPVYAARNLAVARAKQLSADYLVMVDNDMLPDDPPHPSSKTFWQTAFKLAWDSNEPLVAIAPALNVVGNVCVYDQNVCHLLAQEEAFQRTGVQQVPCAGGSLSLWDMRCFQRLKPPYFQHVYADPSLTQVAADECARVMLELGAHHDTPTLCLWDHWSTHRKSVDFGRPPYEAKGE